MKTVLVISGESNKVLGCIDSDDEGKGVSGFHEESGYDAPFVFYFQPVSVGLGTCECVIMPEDLALEMLDKGVSLMADQDEEECCDSCEDCPGCDTCENRLKCDGCEYSVSDALDKTPFKLYIVCSKGLVNYGSIPFKKGVDIFRFKDERENTGITYDFQVETYGPIVDNAAYIIVPNSDIAEKIMKTDKIIYTRE